MGLREWFFPEQAQAVHMKRLADAMTRQMRRSGPSKKILQMIEQDIDFLSLLVAVLIVALERKGVISREDITSLFAKMDAMDGKMDGKLDIRVLRKLLAEGE